MSLFVAAIGATVTAIFELTVGPYLRVGNAQPHPRTHLRDHLDGRGRARKRARMGLRRGHRPRCPGSAAARCHVIRTHHLPSASQPHHSPIHPDPATRGRSGRRAPQPRVLNDLFCAPRRLWAPQSPAPIPSASSRRAWCTTLSSPSSSGRSPLRSTIATRRRASRLVSTYLDGRREYSRPLSRFLVFGLAVVVALSGSDRPAVLPPGSERRPVRGAGRRQPDDRPGDPVDSRPDLRPVGRGARHERADVRRQDPAGRPARGATRRGRRRLSASIGTCRRRHQRRDRRQPRLPFRPRSRSPRTSPRRRPTSSPRPASSCPGVEVVVEARRQYPEGPLALADPRLHRTRLRRPAPRPRSKGYLPDDLLGKTGLEAYYEEQLRGTYGTRDRRARRLGPQAPGPRHDQPGAGRRFTPADDRHQGAEVRSAGARNGA